MHNKGYLPVMIGIAAAAILITVVASLGAKQTPQTENSIPPQTFAELDSSVLGENLDEMANAIREAEESATADAESAAMEAKEASLISVVNSDPRITAYEDGTYGHIDDFTPAAHTKSGMDEMTVYVVGERLPVKGDWKTGYKTTYTGVFELLVSIDTTGKIVSIEKTEMPDVVRERTFSPDRQVAIEKALVNANVTKALDGKSELIVQRAMPSDMGEICPGGSCYFMMIEEQSTGYVLTFFYNPTTDATYQLES